MEDLEQAIQGVLNDPQMMQKIMGMAQALGGNPGEGNPSGSEKTVSGPDLSQLSGLLKEANIDSDQQNLLKALSPYISSPHIGKLRRAMQAARLAELAGTFLGNRQAGGQSV